MFKRRWKNIGKTQKHITGLYASRDYMHYRTTLYFSIFFNRLWSADTAMVPANTYIILKFQDFNTEHAYKYKTKQPTNIKRREE